MLVNVYSNGSKKPLLEKFKPLSFAFKNDKGSESMKVINADYGEKEIYRNVKTQEWELRIIKTRKKK